MRESTVALLSTHRHPRLRYVIRELTGVTGHRFRLFTQEEQWRAAKVDYRCCYGLSRPAVPSLPANDFLSGKLPKKEDLLVKVDDGLPVFFTDPSGIPDLLSCIFFALSRYEEYGPGPRDGHGRFTAADSHAQRWGYLPRPVVAEWAERLITVITGKTSPQSPNDWSLQLTYDVDIPWAWQHRGWRGVAAGLRDLLTGHWQRARNRFFGTNTHDPYWTFEQLENLHREHGLGVLYFWLLSEGKNRHDPNTFPIPAAQRDLIRQLSQRQVCGIHPSYEASDRPPLLDQERARLEEITGKTITRSRQHFLRFRLPDTYRQLYHAGIQHDYSMGYADAIGWRAGTNRPFYWYDLDREGVTGFRVHPFGAMEVTLKQYLDLGPREAKAEILALAAATLPYGGPFTLLWHNSSFSAAYGWRGWWEMYQQLVAELLDLRSSAT
ncbi:polysaccharide deacetylase family protein [Lewinella sp. W8]|uniref:polysaccharide deacetylase family protein n=1 Tax=Lewinella sp. W8 TaxID=2528208 RepID=UPI001067A20D|nr:polysaccharide deacetylase family protein [Lewinella sp. W8]MTB52168.1 hypothetical protein [Lewinella sp. W8]